MVKRGRWAEQAVASYFRKHGCTALTNVYDVKEIDVLGICIYNNILEIYIVEVKSGRQLIDTPVLRRLRYVTKRIIERKTKTIEVLNRKITITEYIPVLVIGPRCALTPQAVEYAKKYNIKVFRYQTTPGFEVNRII